MDTPEEEMRARLEADAYERRKKTFERRRKIGMLEPYEKVRLYESLIDAVLSFAIKHQKSSLYCREIIAMITEVMSK